MPMATPSERDVRLKFSYSIEEGHFTDLLCDVFERRRDLTHISSACGFGACVGKYAKIVQKVCSPKTLLLVHIWYSRN